MKMDNLKKTNIVEKFALILIIFYIFLGYIVNKEVFQLMFTVVFSIIAILSTKKYKIKLYTNDLIWIIIAILVTLSLLYSIDKNL